jgi:hypothetical protein
MPTYTVHAPPSRNGSAADPQRFVFVRDGFHFWAFLVTPLWLLYRRLWLVLLGYVVLLAILEGAFYLLKLPEGARIAIDLLIGLLIGLEAGTLRRWTYARRKWRTLGVVTGDREEAEHRFFSQWVAGVDELPAAPQPVAAPLPPVRASDNDIIGLFPQPRGPS